MQISNSLNQEGNGLKDKQTIKIVQSVHTGQLPFFDIQVTDQYSANFVP